MEPSNGAGPQPARSGRRFRIGTAAYVLVVLGMLSLSEVTGWWFLVAEIATLPIGIAFFTGGVWIVAAVGMPLGGAGVILFHGAFAVSAVLNAVLLREVARFVGQRRRYRRRPGPHRA